MMPWNAKIKQGREVIEYYTIVLIDLENCIPNISYLAAVNYC